MRQTSAVSNAFTIPFVYQMCFSMTQKWIMLAMATVTYL